MSALANLAKYTGRYDLGLQIRQRYNLKWSSGNNNYDESLQSFERLFNDDLGFDSMLQRILQLMAYYYYYSTISLTFINSSSVLFSGGNCSCLSLKG
jgi:hypothetical protein